MSSDDNLPVILVSAVDTPTASAIITELIHDGTEPQCNGVSHDGDEEHKSAAIWHLSNKYYTASVRLRALADGDAPDPSDDVQAHILYLTEDECADTLACVRRAAACPAPRHAVRLLAARAAREPGAVAAWARSCHYELVPLLAPPVERDDDEPFPETTGVARLREALHAHAWPGMRRAGAVRAPAPDLNDDSSASSESSWGSWSGADEAGAVQRAEQFADALALLPARHAEGDDDAARRLHAEQLVVAFCQALGHDLNLDGDL